MVDCGCLEEYILKHFQYHPDGRITRDDRRNSTGSYDHYGYLIIKVKGRQFKAHRIAWLLNYGRFPKSELDHINRNPADNRIENLREADRFIQNRNKTTQIDKKTGIAGVHRDDKTKGLNKKYNFKYLGKTYRFYTLEEAIKTKEQLCLINS